MYLVFDNATNNVLAECETFTEAENYRIRIVGINPPLAEYIEVIDFQRVIDDGHAAAPAREAAPAA